MNERIVKCLSEKADFEENFPFKNRKAFDSTVDYKYKTLYCSCGRHHFFKIEEKNQKLVGSYKD